MPRFLSLCFLLALSACGDDPYVDPIPAELRTEECGDPPMCERGCIGTVGSPIMTTCEARHPTADDRTCEQDFVEVAGVRGCCLEDEGVLRFFACE